MTVTVRVLKQGIILIEWPGRLTPEIKETLFWLLDAVDGVDRITHGNYSTEILTAAHLTDTRLVAALVGNALLDDEELAHFLELHGWGDLEVTTE